MGSTFIGRFEAAWQGGQPPTLDDFLPPTSAERLVVLAELVRVDLAHRLRAGQQVRVEMYLERYPELGQTPELIPELIAAEFLFRLWGEPGLRWEEYPKRFPGFADELTRCLPEVLAAAVRSTLDAWGKEPPAHLDQALPQVPGYEVLGELGRGGMSVVYKARQVGLNRLVALKMIRDAGTATAAEVARFRAEAEAVARLQHPHIVQIHEVGEVEGRPFFSLELVDGGSLADHLDGTPWPYRQAAQLVEVLARTVHAAHLRHIIHRDLKPGNILLQKMGPAEEGAGRQGAGRSELLRLSPAPAGPGGGPGVYFFPKVADFGLAKQLDRARDPTVTGAIVGTPSYMAPEQAWGNKLLAVGPAADVYSLGAILYELLTGRPPFRAETPMDTVLQVVAEEPVPVRRLRPNVPRDVETVCLKCLEKQPRKRYPSAEALADELHRLGNGEPIQARPVGWAERLWRWCRRKPALALTAALAVVALAAGTVVSTLFALHAYRAAGRETRARELMRRQRDLAEERLAENYLDRALAECQREQDPALGMLYLCRALEEAPGKAAALRHAIRANLAAWRGEIHPLRMILTHQSDVLAVAFRPDGRAVLTGSWDGTARLWDAATGRALGPPLRHAGPVQAVAFSPDGKKVLTGSRDGTARLWEATTGHGLGPVLRHEGPVHAVAFGPRGRTVLTGGRDGKVRPWDPDAGTPRSPVLAHGSPVLAVAFSPDGTKVLTGGEDGKARLWDRATGRPLGPALRHQGEVYAVAFRPDGGAVLTGSADDTARLWEIGTGRPLGLPLPHQADVLAVAFRGDGKVLATGSRDGTARLWETATGRPLGLPLRHPEEVHGVAFSPDGKAVLTGSGDGEARLWEASAGQLPKPALLHDGVICAVAFRPPDGKVLLTGSLDGTAQLWSSANGQALGPPLRHNGPVRAVAFSPRGNRVLTGSGGGEARLWSSATGQALGPPLRHAGPVQAVAFSPDGRLLGTGCQDGKARLWDAATGRPHGEPLAHRGPVSALAFSPDGRLLLTGSRDGLAQVWDVATGRARGKPLRHLGPVLSVAFHPGGKVLLTGSGHGMARLWETETGKPVGRALRHSSWVLAVAFSPDGQTLLTGSRDGTAQLWSAASGKPVGPALPHQGAVGAVAFRPDGRAVLTGSADRTARLWDVPTPVRGEPRRIKLWVQVITGVELDEHDMLRVLPSDQWRQSRRRLHGQGGPPLLPPAEKD